MERPQQPVELPDLSRPSGLRIAIVRALYLGDLLCATPAFGALRARFPHAELTLIGLPWAADFVARSPHLDRFLAFPGWPGMEDEPPDQAGPSPFLATARAEGYDLAIQLHGDGTASNGFVAALGARVSFGYRRDPADRRLDWTLPYRDGEHETLRWLRLVGLLGARSRDHRPVFPFGQAEIADAAALLEGHPTRASHHHQPLIGLHVGAKDPSRRWPAARFAALGNLLWARYGAALVLTGSAGEREIAAAVLRDLQAPAFNLVGRTSLGAFAALIARLDLLVTNDTGASHLAAATGTPSVVLFGPTKPQCWAPLDPALHRPLDARALVPWCADGTQALHSLPIEPVMVACAQQLGLIDTRQSASMRGATIAPDRGHADSRVG